MTDWRHHISQDEAIMQGKPVVTGTRLTVQHIMSLKASGWSEDQILDSYPKLTQTKLSAVYLYIEKCMSDSSSL